MDGKGAHLTQPSRGKKLRALKCLCHGLCCTSPHGSQNPLCRTPSCRSCIPWHHRCLAAPCRQCTSLCRVRDQIQQEGSAGKLLAEVEGQTLAVYTRTWLAEQAHGALLPRVSSCFAWAPFQRVDLYITRLDRTHAHSAQHHGFARGCVWLDDTAAITVLLHFERTFSRSPTRLTCISHWRLLRQTTSPHFLTVPAKQINREHKNNGTRSVQS